MSWINEKEELAREILSLLYRHKMIRTFFRDKPKGWTLISGLYSPLYIQLRPLISFPGVFERACRGLTRLLQEEAPQITKVIGIAMAGVPIAAGMAIAGGVSAGFTRKLDNVRSIESFRAAAATYGEHTMVEGEIRPGDKIALVDDLVTRFDSKLIASEQVKYELTRRRLSDVECRTVVVVVDREQGAEDAARQEGMDLLSLIPFLRVGMPLLRGAMNPAEWDVIHQYLLAPDRFQDPDVQQDLAKLSGRGDDSGK